jgi:hypothetical protein
MGATHPKRRCQIQGCKSWRHGRGLCALHYKRWLKYGDAKELKRIHFRDLTSKRFGRLRVIERARKTAPRRTFWSCQCDCGRKTTVETSNLQSGDVRSCGCLRRELYNKGGGALKHGAARSRPLPEYRIWCAMKARCANPKHKNWADYGGRGILVCRRWLHSFPNFLKDMGKRPSSKRSIQRSDNNRGYSPQNCCWATAKEQAANRRPNRGWKRKHHPV